MSEKKKDVFLDLYTYPDTIILIYTFLTNSSKFKFSQTCLHLYTIFTRYFSIIFIDMKFPIQKNSSIIDNQIITNNLQMKLKFLKKLSFSKFEKMAMRCDVSKWYQEFQTIEKVFESILENEKNNDGGGVDIWFNHYPKNHLTSDVIVEILKVCPYLSTLDVRNCNLPIFTKTYDYLHSFATSLQRFGEMKLRLKPNDFLDKLENLFQMYGIEYDRNTVYKVEVYRDHWGEEMFDDAEFDDIIGDLFSYFQDHLVKKRIKQVKGIYDVIKECNNGELKQLRRLLLDPIKPNCRINNKNFVDFFNLMKEKKIKHNLRKVTVYEKVRIIDQEKVCCSCENYRMQKSVFDYSYELREKSHKCFKCGKWFCKSSKDCKNDKYVSFYYCRTCPNLFCVFCHDEIDKKCFDCDKSLAEY